MSGGHALGLKHAGHVAHYDFGAYAVEVEALAAGEYRGRQALRLSGSEYEHGVRRRLFERLEQRIERARAEHVHLVDDVDAVLAYRRRIHYLVAQVAYLIDAGVGCGVDLDYVHGRSGLLVEARRAFAAGFAVLRIEAVERARERLGGGRLTGAARAAEQVRVRYAPGVYLIEQRAHYCVLSYYVGEPCGPPGAV